MSSVFPLQRPHRQLSLYASTLIVSLALFALVLWSLGLFSVKGYFVLSFIWFLVLNEVFSPFIQDSRWWMRIQLLKLGGWVVFGYIVIELVLRTLP